VNEREPNDQRASAVVKITSNASTTMSIERHHEQIAHTSSATTRPPLQAERPSPAPTTSTDLHQRCARPQPSADGGSALPVTITTGTITVSTAPSAPTRAAGRPRCRQTRHAVRLRRVSSQGGERPRLRRRGPDPAPGHGPAVVAATRPDPTSIWRSPQGRFAVLRTGLSAVLDLTAAPWAGDTGRPPAA
jgi:hypothetical protein